MPEVQNWRSRGRLPAGRIVACALVYDVIYPHRGKTRLTYMGAELGDLVGRVAGARAIPDSGRVAK